MKNIPKNIFILLLITLLTFLVTNDRFLIKTSYKKGHADGYVKGFEDAANERFIIVTDTNIYFKLNATQKPNTTP